MPHNKFFLHIIKLPTQIFTRTVSTTTFIVSVLVVCVLVSVGISLAITLKPSSSKSGSTEPTADKWPVDFNAGLIIRTGHDVQAYNIQSDKSVQLLPKSVNYVDFYKNKTLYYANSGDNEPVHAILGDYPSLKYPGESWCVAALAVDFVTEKVYVYDQQASKLELYDMQGMYMGIVLSELYIVKDIMLDFWKGYLFILQSSKILLAGMDGVGLKEIVQDTDIVGFALDFHHTLLYYSKGNVIMAHDYFSTHKTYEVAKIDKASSVFSLAVTEATLYHLSKNKNNSMTEFNSCDLGSPTPTGKCLNPRIRNFTDDPRQLKAFDMLDLQLRNNSCQQMNGGCEQLCVMSAVYVTAKIISCQCHIGWQLNLDVKTCSPVKTYLMYVRSPYLKGRILDLEKKSFIDVIEPIHLMLNSSNPVHFDLHVSKGYVVYADESNLWRLNFQLAENQKRLELLDGDSEFHMLYPTIDWINDQLYYLRRHIKGDNSSYLMVRYTNGSGGFGNQKIIYKIPENRQPRAMVLSLKFGFIYFTVLEANYTPAIYKMNTDGSGLMKFVVRDTKFSVSEVGLAYDYESSNVYWFNAKRTQVQFATRAGTILRTIDISKVKNPVTINTHREWMYIGNGNSVWRFHKETGLFVWNVFAQSGDDYQRIFSMIKTFDDGIQPILYNHPCSNNKGGCQRYCFGVPINGKLERVCGCNENEELQEDKTTCKKKIV